jgi:cyclin-dependent kinase 4
LQNQRLLDVIHRRADRENQLELFLVFEYLERDLADYISHLPTTTVIPSHQIQVRKDISTFFMFLSNADEMNQSEIHVHHENLSSSFSLF